MTQGRIHSLESFGTVDGPGTRYVVFTQGCPMRCLYCHNPDTWSMTAGEMMDPEYIYEQYLKNEPFYQNGGGLTVTGGEPLLQVDFLIDLFTLLKEHGVHTTIDTSGITYKPENIEYNKKLDKLMEMTDLVMLDIKHIDPEIHRKVTSQPNDGILAFAQYVSDKGVELWIRHVVVPNLTDDEVFLYKLGYFIGGLKTLKALDVLPYHTMGKVKYEKLGIEYPLGDTPPMDKGILVEKKQSILNGIKARRADDEKNGSI